MPFNQSKVKSVMWKSIDYEIAGAKTINDREEKYFLKTESSKM